MSSRGERVVRRSTSCSWGALAGRPGYPCPPGGGSVRRIRKHIAGRARAGTFPVRRPVGRWTCRVGVRVGVGGERGRGPAVSAPLSLVGVGRFVSMVCGPPCDRPTWVGGGCAGQAPPVHERFGRGARPGASDLLSASRWGRAPESSAPPPAWCITLGDVGDRWWVRRIQGPSPVGVPGVDARSAAGPILVVPGRRPCASCDLGGGGGAFDPGAEDRCALIGHPV